MKPKFGSWRVFCKLGCRHLLSAAAELSMPQPLERISGLWSCSLSPGSWICVPLKRGIQGCGGDSEVMAPGVNDGLSLLMQLLGTSRKFLGRIMELCCCQHSAVLWWTPGVLLEKTELYSCGGDGKLSWESRESEISTGAVGPQSGHSGGPGSFGSCCREFATGSP